MDGVWHSTSVVCGNKISKGEIKGIGQLSMHTQRGDRYSFPTLDIGPAENVSENGTRYSAVIVISVRVDTHTIRAVASKRGYENLSMKKSSTSRQLNVVAEWCRLS